MNDKQNEKYATIDLFELLREIWNRKIIVIAFLIVGITFSLINSIFFTQHTYTADGTIYVSSESQSLTENAQYVNPNAIYTARILSSTYVETLYLRSFLMDVSSDIGGKYNWMQISSMISIEILNETELLSISVTANSPEDAYMITRSMLKLAPEKLNEVTKGGSIKIIDDVVMPTRENGKGTIRNALLAAIISVVLAAILIFVITLLDTRVRKGEDIAKRYNVSILGTLNK